MSKLPKPKVRRSAFTRALRYVLGVCARFVRVFVLVLSAFAPGMPPPPPPPPQAMEQVEDTSGSKSERD